MSIVNKKEPIILFFGDLVLLFLSLWTALLFRYFNFPDWQIFVEHIEPFSIIFIVWLFMFYITGLYEKHTLILKNKLPNIIFNALILNTVLAVIFFYFIPYFGITPKTILFIYLLISFTLISIWRLKILNLFQHHHRQKAILIGEGEEMKNLHHEINNNNRYDFVFVDFVDLTNNIKNIKDSFLHKIYQENINIIVLDIKNKKNKDLIPELYKLLFSKVEIIDKYDLYESIFDRIPVSILNYDWFLQNISTKTKFSYDFFKRVMDILLALILGFISLVIYPIVFVLIKIQDGGSIFFSQFRVGQNNKIIKIYKFRTMTDGPYKKVTKLGKFLRIFRIDELPQIWNVLKGDLSFIGPRPETVDLVDQYSEQVPFYNIRHILKPGLSGWAQIYHDNHPHHNIDILETKNKLSYDLFYVKNRSIFLDLKIALKTLKTFFLRKGK